MSPEERSQHLEVVVAKRVPGLDVLRASAAVLVLFQHVTGEIVSRHHASASVAVMNGVSWIAVWLFFAASGWLYGRSSAKGDFDLRGWFAKRLPRLLLPYVAWSAVYLLLAYGYARFRGIPAAFNWSEVIFWGGAFYTLWFLPSLVYASVVVALLGRSRRMLALLAMASFVLVALPEASAAIRLPSFVVRVLGPVAVFSAGAFISRREISRPAAYFWAFVGVALTAAGGFAAWQGGPERMGIVQMAAALAWLVAAAGLVGKAPRWSSMLSGSLLGLYLVHGGVLFVLTKLLPTSTLPQEVWVIAATIVVGAISVGIVRMMRGAPLLRPLVS